MLEKDITVDDESQYFEIPRNHNHSDTASRSDTNMFDKVLVEPDTLQCQKYTINFYATSETTSIWEGVSLFSNLRNN